MSADDTARPAAPGGRGVGEGAAPGSPAGGVASWGPFEAIRGLRPDGVLPQVTPVRRLIPDLPLETDPYGAARAALDDMPTEIRPGARIAVTAGSRGIRDLVPVVKAAVDWLRAAGAEP